MKRLITSVLLALGVAAFGFGLATNISATAAPTAGKNPPGNNGTVKVDGVVFDTLPNNQPHVSCTFQIDFYGYDEGDFDATVTFALQSPTATGRTLSVTSGQGNPSTVFIGEDDNTGGGSEAGLDAEETYTLAFTGDPHPIQGYHVKLTINAPGSIGADVKHKVFWVGPCETTTTTQPTTTTLSTAPTTTTLSTAPTTTTLSTAPTTTTTSVLPSTSSTTQPTTTSSHAPPTSVLPTTRGPRKPVTSVLPTQSHVGPVPTAVEAGLSGPTASSPTPAGNDPNLLGVVGMVAGLAMASAGAISLRRSRNAT